LAFTSLAQAAVLVGGVLVTTFIVPGRPTPKERPRRGKAGNFYTPAKTRRYEEAVAYHAMATGLRLERGAQYRVTVHAYTYSHAQDADNIGKVIGDGLNRYGKPTGFDDRQIVSLLVHKHRVPEGGTERVVVTVEEL
jgi:Holliday junction resolvase RusA-like endonuclease